MDSESPSSAEAAPRWKHDVFLSFSPKDTGRNFISHLCDELQSIGIKVSIDEDFLEKRKSIEKSLIMAVGESRFALVVLSENYASSRWNLDELTRILQLMRGENRIIPLFYGVEPRDVRYQIAFAKAFAEHKRNFSMESHRVKQWRDALSEVANLSGWPSRSFDSAREFVECIGEYLLDKLRPDEERRQPTPLQWKHDVFLSFRGIDTRKGFLSHLYEALENTKVIKTFKDDQELVTGSIISPSLIEAIKQSCFAVVILSSNYASSAWCLEELNKIFECMEDPSVVRYQLKSFEEAFKKHEERENEIKVKRWRTVLRSVANLSGWDSNNYKKESQLVKHVVELVRSKVTREAMARTTESAPRWKHDVFLSFWHQDSSKDFVSHLYHELQNKREIRTFKNKGELEKTMAITPNLLMAIEESRFAIVVMSKNYAQSTWCLDELSKIFQCMEGKDTILPIFYDALPNEYKYEVDLSKHSKSGHDIEKVRQWRVVLQKLVNLPDRRPFRSERELIKDIVDVVRPISTLSAIDFEAFEATKQATKEVMNAFKKNAVTMAGVHGMAGIGKTTMVKHIGARAQKDGTFDHVVMVVVSQTVDLKKVQGTLAVLLGMELEEETTDARAKRLYDRFMAGRSNILVILDDIWEKIELSSIGIPSSKFERQRCKLKILLTTRLLTVCDSMECEANITLDFLSEDDSWQFFQKKSGKTIQETSVFYNVARKAARECVGLPSALKAVARGLSDKHLGEWKEAALRLKACQLDVFESIRLSYHSFLGDAAKSWLLLCCLFPKGDDIQITDLLKYGLGKGVYRDADTIEQFRDRATLVVQELKDCSLLLNGTEEGCVRIHNVIWDVVIFTALCEDDHGQLVKAGCELEDWPIDAHEGYSAISLMKNRLHKLPQKLICPQLQILLLRSNAGISEIPETFFQSQNALKVLDLSGTSISSLTPSFTHLNILHALYLDYCKNLTDISKIGSMTGLKILSMRESSVTELPEELGQLTNLRMLDVTDSCLHSVPSEVIPQLEKLEELYFQYNFRDWGSQVERAGVGSRFTNAGFDELTGLPSLNILKVCISDAKCLPETVGCNPHWTKYDICINRQGSKSEFTLEHEFPHHSSRSLTLDTAISNLPKWFINVVTKTAETLRYLECEGLKNILEEYEQGSLDGLKYLAVIGPHEQLEELMNAATLVVPDEPVFKNLEELHLIEVDSLEKLCVGILPTGSLCKLKLLKVQACHNLVNTLLPSDLLQELQNLEELVCRNVDRIEHVFGPEWIRPAPHAISNNVKILVISRCAKLKYIFTSSVAQCFSRLEDLWIDHCDSLDNVIEEQADNSKIVFLKLKNLVLMDLPQLIWFFNRSAIIESPLLEHLHIEDCPQLLTPAFEFHSKKKVQLNDVQNWWSLKKRLLKDVEDS